MLTYSLPKLSSFITLPPGTAGCKSAGITANEPNPLVDSIYGTLRETIFRFDMGKVVQCYYWCTFNPFFRGSKRVNAPLPDGFHQQGHEDEESDSLYWQLYKSLAAYRMALREEKRRGGEFKYDWIVRARFDVAWVRPLPPLSSFSREAVWFGPHYW